MEIDGMYRAHEVTVVTHVDKKGYRVSLPSAEQGEGDVTIKYHFR